MNCYVMNRRGTFTTSTMTNNQCKEPGHRTYHYEVAIAFSPHTKLDENMFIIDHKEINKCIQKCILRGSCEEMHVVMSSALRDMFTKRKIKVLGMKTIIHPDMPITAANLSYIWLAPKSKDILPLLNVQQ